MPILATKILKVDRCTNGIYLRWYHTQGGWHHLLVQTKTEGELQAANKDIKTDIDFSRISKSQSLTGKDFTVTYQCGLIGLSSSQKDAVVGLLDCETVQWYRNNAWQNIDINRGSFNIRRGTGVAYNIEFTFEFENFLEDV